MSDKKSKAIYWLLRSVGVIVSCAFPIWAICDHFPIWTEQYGTGQSLGAGGILILIVLLVVFRSTVFSIIKERLKLQHTPPIVAWIVMIVISYTLMYINKVLYDMTIIFWMGLIGCAIGTLLSFIAESRFRKDVDGNG